MILTLIWAAGCSPLGLLNASVSTRGYVQTRAIAYGSDPLQRLDVYVPDRAASKRDQVHPERGLPVVVFVHGGNWQTGDRGGYRFVGQALASRGIVCVVIDYRKYPQVVYPYFIHDAASAVAWTKAHAIEFGGDHDRIFMMGHSAGAYTAAMVALDARYLDKVGLTRASIAGTICLAGPFDFQLEAGDREVFSLVQGQPMPKDALPVTYVDGGASPMLLVHGLKDEVVKPQNSWTLAERINEKSGKVKLITYKSSGHIGVLLGLASSFRSYTPVLDDVSGWILSLHDSINVK